MSRRICPSLRAFRFCAVFALTAASLIGGLGISLSSAAVVDTGPAVSGSQVLGWGFGQPNAVSSDGTDVWVANSGGNSVTELSASTGALVHVVLGSKYGFDYPVAISSDGTEVWVANFAGRLGDRAERGDGRPGSGHLGLDVRVRLSVGHLLRRHPRLGGEPFTATR